MAIEYQETSQYRDMVKLCKRFASIDALIAVRAAMKTSVVIAGSATPAG